MNDYTVDELQIHYEAAIRFRAEQQVMAATAVRVGNNAGKNDWRLYVKQLQNTWREIELSQGRTIVKADAFFRGLDATIASAKAKKKGTGHGDT